MLDKLIGVPRGANPNSRNSGTYERDAFVLLIILVILIVEQCMIIG